MSLLLKITRKRVGAAPYDSVDNRTVCGEKVRTSVNEKSYPPTSSARGISPREGSD